MLNNKIEITAPVGSFESLSASVQAGADSVYFGAGKLNMRSKSSFNFSLDDLRQIRHITSGNNMKAYLTVNSVIYDNDIQDMTEILHAAKEVGIDAVICSDIAALQMARQLGLNVHCSTQLNISNIEAVKFFAQFADVMVLARELSLDKVKFITDEIRRQNITGPRGELIKIEVFAHGALCMAISGKCYLSLHLHDHSANRGECLQTCRRKYIATESEQGYSLEIDNEYIMSPKDLCTIGFLDKVLDAGVEILKIEGRGRPPEYVKRVVECYKEAVSAIDSGTYDTEKIEQWNNRLSEVFNRGFWDGYYLGKTIGEWNNMHGSAATKKKVYIGYVKNYYPNVEAAALQIQAESVALGDEILITGNKTGAVEHIIEQLRLDNIPVESVDKGNLCSISIGTKIRPNDKLYKIVAV